MLLSITILFSNCGPEPLPASGTVPQEKFKKLLSRKDIQIIDVRTPEEYRAGHIPHAQNINLEQDGFMLQMEQKDKKQPYLLYCQGGFRSAAALRMLQQAGFEHLYDLENGLGQWKGKLDR